MANRYPRFTKGDLVILDEKAWPMTTDADGAAWVVEKDKGTLSDPVWLKSIATGARDCFPRENLKKVEHS